MGKINTPVVPRSTTGNRTATNQPVGWQRWLPTNHWGLALTGIWTLLAAIATALDLGAVRLVEQQAQTLFFEVRGSIAAPENVVILAIDEESLNQGQFYSTDPKRYAHLEPLQAWPWRRAAHAAVIEKLMAAGAQSVSFDVIFDTPSSYGTKDDQQFKQVLQRYADRVVLATQYVEIETDQGFVTQKDLPNPILRDAATRIGSINFYKEPDGRIHRLGEQFMTELLQNQPTAQAAATQVIAANTPTFATGTLQAARIDYPPPRGNFINFHGPQRTFEHIPYWYVLDPATWRDKLQSGAYFRDKIVLVGSTAAVHQDFHPVPFGSTWLYPLPMPGVEIHANAIASLMAGQTFREAIPQAPLRGVLVFILVATTGWLLAQPRQLLRRWVWAMAVAIVWSSASYFAFVWGYWLVPTGVPVVAIVLTGFSHLLLGTATEQLRRRRLRDTLRQYVTSPIVQEIISQQDDFHDLLRERNEALFGKILSGRYRIVKVLGSGGFSETYIAEDLQRPGNPTCVVKQLRVVSDNPETWKVAQRLFATEAETLEKLGRHDQIPRLMASFEENSEFYLVQDLIHGHPLSHELHQPLSESYVLSLLDDLLTVLDFVHRQGVIHRDLKPSNIIRRKSDQKLVLIDFGIAKKITTQLVDLDRQTKFTIAVGTPGYMPGEQAAGRPHFNSDLYALGVIAIEALTGLAPSKFKHHPKTGKLLWHQPDLALHPTLVEILDRMVEQDFNQRYTSVAAVRKDLAEYRYLTPPTPLSLPSTGSQPTANVTPNSLSNSAIEPNSEHDLDRDLDTDTIPLPDDLLPSIAENNNAETNNAENNNAENNNAETLPLPDVAIDTETISLPEKWTEADLN